MPIVDCLKPFNQFDRQYVQSLIDELRRASGDLFTPTATS